MVFLALWLAGILLLSTVLVWILGIRLQIVPVEERLVIYRNGRPHRLGGPGWTWLLTRIEEVKRTLNVRDQPNEVLIAGLNFSGVPFGYKINIRYKIDPAATAPNRSDFLKLLQFEDHEFRRQVQITMRDALLKIVSSYAAEQNFLPTTPIGAKFAFIRPGTEGANLILSRLQNELEPKLPGLGIVVNHAYPLMITQFLPDEGLVENLKRERDVDSIRRRWGDLDPEIMAQLYASEKDLDLPQVQKHIVESGPGAKVEMRLEDDNTQVRVKPMLEQTVETASKAAAQPASTQSTPVQSTLAQSTLAQQTDVASPTQVQSTSTEAAARTVSEPVADSQASTTEPVSLAESAKHTKYADPMRLSREDLSVLKIVPPLREGQRQAA